MRRFARPTAHVSAVVSGRQLLVAISTTIALSACSSDMAPSVTDPVAPASLDVSHSRSGDVIPRQFLVLLDNNVADVPGLARRLAVSARGQLGFTYTAALKGFSLSASSTAAWALLRNPNVVAVEPARVIHTDGTQLNPLSWGLDRVDQRALPLNASFTYGQTGAGVNVYVLDTGIRTTHAEFGGRAFGAYTAISDGKGTNDCNGHGTHVAGTIAGALTGVAKGARVHAVRVLDCNGSGSSSGLIAGLDWVVRNAPRPAIANMSLAGSASSMVNTAIANAVSAGVTVVVSAGNYTADACLYSPASAPSALTVGASDRYDNFATYSNWGSCVDIVAPGTGIRSAAIDSDTAHTQMSGTSMASPHVAGAAALILESNPSATPAQVASTLSSSATVGVLLGNLRGSPNQLLHVSSAVSTPPPSDTTTTPPPDSTTPPPPDSTTPPPPDSTSPPPADQSPQASFSASCPKGNCTFDASASKDDKGIVSYAWTFGNGSSTTTANPVAYHTYAASGTYTVTLTVTDAAGQKATTQAKVKVSKPRK